MWVGQEGDAALRFERSNKSHLLSRSQNQTAGELIQSTGMRKITTQTVTVTVGELMAAVLHHHRKRLWFDRCLVMVGLIPLTISILDPEKRGLIPAALIPLVGLLDYLYILVLYRKIFSDPANKLLVPASATFDDLSLTIENDAGVVQTLPWHVFTKVERVGENYMLYHNRLQFILMLRRAQTAEDWSAFEEHLTALPSAR